MDSTPPMTRLLFPLLLVLAACEAEDPHGDCRPADLAPRQFDANADILEQLRSIPQLATLEERTSRYADLRLFVMEFVQPIDHCQPDGDQFRQTLTLLFRDRAAPMVYATNGYAISRNPTRSEPTVLLTGNQLQVEHRYFSTSRPAQIPWETLNIFQAASDHHRIVQAFGPLLTGDWVSTGASKGGMTAIFHRYFYPDDVKATVAYVAPETFGLEDPRYVTFLETVGEASCRDALKAFQRGVLSRRAELEPALEQYGVANDYAFTTFGLEKSLEFATLESSFAFWQYGDASMCPTIPAPDAPAAELLEFMRTIGVLDFLDDFALEYYAPYFYQSATELGSPAYPQAHLLDLNGGQPIPDRVEDYPPLGVPKPFDPQVMEQVHAWVRDHGQRILFVYGENDPWTAGSYEPNLGGDSHLFTVPGGNHGANLGRLPEPDLSTATAVLRGWIPSAPPPVFPLRAQPGEQPASRLRPRL